MTATPTSSARRTLRVDVPVDLFERITAAAERRNITRTGLVKVILSATFPPDEAGQ